ncbi:flavin-containing monooxygenase [Kineobactrum salinum]|uniref:NAD(P)/FAD-dependent oxidoreductase n=1 Tax=Kineobactrum salinum TaxID=2708301 RepID=A0A6C0TZ64_9GAMM|nr:NAD(P)/FAD-dependent oxidoreductase [Kineobactrum salinum]QIB65066.1 NAD(P)/FAD-dependent oxidoreductase [Kineobactrum salinum]
MQNDTPPDDTTSDINIETWRKKFLEERDRRLRADGEHQYIKAAGSFARYLEEDPYASESVQRSPIVDEVEVVIIGGGFSGIMAGAYLRKAGIDDFRILETASDFGGSWYWNRYPGAQCDIEGYIYLPLLEETGYVPKVKYPFAGEIFQHCQRVGTHFNLYENACFQTKVNGLNWDESLKRWIVRTNRDDAIKARFVILSVGVGGKAKLPGIPGIEDFEGVSFHSSHWDYDYTGGEPNAERWDASDEGDGGTPKLDKLGDKTVAVIGTGASAIQCIPYLARDAKQVYVFQRTPNMVSERGGNPKTDPKWAETLKPGWQKERRENFEDIVTGKPLEKDLVDDCWTHMLKKSKAMIMKPGLNTEEMKLAAEIGDIKLVQDVHKEVESIVRDKEVAEALKPWFRPGCKRPGYNDEYLAAFNRPNLELVDVSDSKGVEKITQTGVVADGKEYQVDCIVFATGFEIAITDFKSFIGFDIVGRNSQSLYEHWGNGIRSLHGYGAHGFPNWFYIGFSQNGFGFNQGYMLDEQVRHVTYIIDQVRKRGATVAEVSREAEEKWDATVREMSRTNTEFLEACTPGFYNNEGQSRGGIASQAYSAGVRAFNDILEQWRNDDKLEGLDLS